MIFQGDDLGITIGSLMKTSAHCVVAVKKASKMLGCIKDRTIRKNITASISLRGDNLNEYLLFFQHLEKSDTLEKYRQESGKRMVEAAP